VKTRKAPAPKRLSNQPFTTTISINVEALVVPEPGGGYSAAIPALDGCGTCARTLEELHRNLIEAAAGWLAVQHETRTSETLGDMTMPLEGEE
jgi:predicted RNase H-like HicB family nuclease